MPIWNSVNAARVSSSKLNQPTPTTVTSVKVSITPTIGAPSGR